MTILRIPSWRPNAPSRKTAEAFARLLFAFVIVAGIVHSGGRYFYCEAMGLLSSDPCVPISQGAPPQTCPAKTLVPRSVDCCEIVTLPSTPDSARVASLHVLPAGVVALISARSWVESLLGDDLGLRRVVLERWRAPPRPSGERRAQLMVFLT